MKKLITIVAVFVLILFLTKMANQAPQDQPSGIVFSLKAQTVVGCTPDEITLADGHQAQTQLFKDSSWPDCASFHTGDVLDYYLARGEKTHFLRTEKTEWWRKSL